ncbi:PH domain-like [Phytophthora cactorum]|nr:PH domain-like [Phytophthora cactorum]
MAWTCTACEFAANEDGQEACVACGSERPEEEEQQQETDAESAQATEENDDSVPEVVVIELPAKEKLGVKLMPPKDGVIDHGLAIDNINNPLLENKVQAGDLIVAIGGQNVDGMGFSDAIDLIRKMPRPLAISFEIDEVRRQEVVREKFQQNKDDDLDKELTTYAVVFDNGPMGLNLEEAVRYGIDGAVVRALKGQAKTSGMITVGDIVYKVNETDVLCMPYLEVMNVLRNATAPKTLQFVPKDKLADVQRVNSRHSESFRLRESTSHVKQKLMNNPRLVKDDGNDGDDNHTIKKGRMYKQGRVMRNWKSRYFVLSVSKVEYFKSPSSTTSRGEMSFLNHRCTVRSLPGTGDVVCRSPNVTAEYLLEIRVDDRRMVMACTSESDKKGWMDAVKLAIDASKTVNRTQSPGESLREAKALRTQRTESLSMDGTFLERNAGGRLSQFNYEAFSTPVVHVGVLSATNLTKSGSSVNALCEVTVGAETFKTSVVKNQRSPVWKQDNSASFEAPSDEMVVEIRIFDEHLFRATELIATLSIPLKSLPNMQKTTKKYPLALGSRSAGAVLTLSLEYVNKQKANGMMNERDEMVKIKAEAQMAADEATHHAARAQEEAHMLLEQSRQKAEAAMAAAREEQREGKAAVEKAMAEAARAKEEAEKQLAEAKRAQEEAQKLIEANRRIQESDVQGPSIYAVYRKMIQDGQSNEDVKKKMQEDGVDEMGIEAFFDGINSYDEKIRTLQAEVEKLKRSRSVRQKEEPRAQDMLANLDISSDQVKLLRRLLKLEKQLQQAGIAVAADIPYEEAMAKVQEISKRMQEIGSADVTHPDPAIQKQLREEYYRLEQDMEKYNTALMLTDEYAAEEARKEREWEEENYEENIKALKAIRRMMPVDVKKMSEADLQTMKSPTGKTLSRDIARKYKRTNVLELIRTDPADIAKNHPSLLDNLRVTGLTVTERRALHMHLRDVAETWKAQQGEEMTKKKYEWFKTLKETFKTVVNSYNKHVKQYGPEDNHPYATRDDPDIGCPMIGKQCPIKANRSPAYDQDLGYPDGDVYMESSVQKGNPDDAGARALAEAQELARAKLANSRADALKKHYRNVRLVAEANGACELIDTSLDLIENRQLLWFQARLKRRLERTETAATIKVELAEFGELVNEIRLASLKFAERSGMNLSGKRDASLDAKDTRSSIECNLILLYCEAVVDCFDGMDERMDEVKASDKRLRSAIPVIRGLLKDLSDKSRSTLGSLKDKGPPVTRRVKTRTEIMKEAKEKNQSAAAPAESEAAEEAPARAPHPMMAARGRGRSGRGGGRNDLFAAISGRGRGGDGDGPPGPPTDFLSSIRGRGRGKPGGPGRGDLFSAIKARGGGDDDGGRGGRGGDLMSAIRGRGGGGGGAPGRGNLMAAIAARKKD